MKTITKTKTARTITQLYSYRMLISFSYLASTLLSVVLFSYPIVCVHIFWGGIFFAWMNMMTRRHLISKTLLLNRFMRTRQNVACHKLTARLLLFHISFVFLIHFLRSLCVFFSVWKIHTSVLMTFVRVQSKLEINNQKCCHTHTELVYREKKTQAHK